jgi:ppGpp synthetase/RelA/SpoT-type nucleotidyltranferase
MAYPEPPSNKSAVRRAGLAVYQNTTTTEDFELIDQWRAAHGYVINNFQAWIKGHIARKTVSVEFAQRLKRKNTVIDKLRRVRPDGSPLIADVTAMHDFAGCRLIFENMDDLISFRNHMRSTAVLRNVEHEIRHDEEKYDYILHPKPSGYRGIHDVYKHFPRGHRRNQSSPRPWDGLKVEIQYRTRAQHAWATAVEISDVLDGERTKFEQLTTERGHFFAVASEVIARNHEGKRRSFVDQETRQLEDELQDLENRLGIMQRLKALRLFEDESKLQEHNVLSIERDFNNNLRLEVYPFKAAQPAIEKATQLESSGESLNAVYVRADNPKQLRSAYRNYFNDPVDFVGLLENEAKLT